MNVFVTGASGFVGCNLIEKIPPENNVIAHYRKNTPSYVSSNINFVKGELFDIVPNELIDIDVIVHCAGVSCIPKQSCGNIFEEVNVNSTVSLIKAAAQSGVKRFIYLSTIKVNGESTSSNKAFEHDDEHNPITDYGISKSKAEKELFSLGLEYGIEVVVIRPTMVYGKGVGGNFEALLKLVYSGVPLPFKSITNNKRSLVSVTNLCDLIITCLDHPNAKNKVFLVSDDDDLSICEIVSLMAKYLSKPGLQISFPAAIFKFIGRVINKQDVINRLVGSLHVDISHTKQTLGWTPSQSTHEAFKETADFYQKERMK